MQQPNPDARPWDLAWIAVPFAIYLLVVGRFWVDTPAWDDYAILQSLLRFIEAKSAREWLAALLAQHNEHRTAVLRLAALAVTAVEGHIDFRVLIVAGNLAFLGAFLVFRAEFRRNVAAPLFAAAALVMFQVSYYEAGTWASAGFPNMGAAFFSFLALYHATHGDARHAAVTIVASLLAIGLAGNGLFILPLAAAVCLLQGRRVRAAVFAGVAVAIFALYFIDYVRPHQASSALVALQSPLRSTAFFLIAIGAILPGFVAPLLTGAAILAALGWLAYRGAWRSHPTAALWVVFILLSTAAATAARVGMGGFHASRYAIYSTCLVVLLMLYAFERFPVRSRRAMGIAIAAGAATSLVVSWASWDDAKKFALNAFLLAKPVPATKDVAVPTYYGVYFPNVHDGTHLLLASEWRGIYHVKRETIYSSAVRPIAEIPATARLAGNLDEAKVNSAHVTVAGWVDIPPNVAGRAFDVHSTPAFAAATSQPAERLDVARATLDPSLAFSGFTLELDYASEDAARKAVGALCIVVEAPGFAPAVLGREGRRCES